MFQTFVCDEFPDVGKGFLTADPRIECPTPTHTAYKLYAAVMLFLCEFIMACFFKSNVNKACPMFDVS